MKTCDKNRRPLMVGDVLKVYHYTAAQRREKVYMYKQIVGLRALGGAKLKDGSTVPMIDYFEVSHLDLGEDGNYHIGMNEGRLDDYEIIQGVDIYPDHWKDREKADMDELV